MRHSLYLGIRIVELLGSARAGEEAELAGPTSRSTPLRSLLPFPTLLFLDLAPAASES